MSAQLSQIVASRLNMQPTLIAPSHVPMVESTLRQLASMDEDQEGSEELKARQNMLSAYGYSSGSVDKPFAYADGIAFIPVTGLLINRFNSSYGWVTGYNCIRTLLNAAIEDDDVELIVFDCNSFGGEVSGCFELAADIFASRAIKPSLAVVDSAAYSAGYALASSATKVIVAPSAGVGSIGVVAMHINYGKMLADSGIEVTFIFSGEHKVDGNAYESLPAPVRKSIQARVDTTRQEFVSLVAKNRGVEEKTIFDTEAQCYPASDAVEIGLADSVTPPLDAVRDYRDITSTRNEKESNMSKTTQPGAENTPATPAQAPAAAVANTDAATSQTSDAMTAAEPVIAVSQEASAERVRIKGITQHAEAANKSRLANHLALNTNLTVDEAVAVLATAVSEKTEEPATNAFTEAMNTSEHPNLGSDTSDGAMTAAQRILKSQAVATGTAS
jgi:signal peptide peptidase SppA